MNFRPVTTGRAIVRSAVDAARLVRDANREANRLRQELRSRPPVHVSCLSNAEIDRLRYGGSD
jgi:hypothetical protein